MDHDDYLAILKLFEDEFAPEKQIQNQLPQQSDPESKLKRYHFQVGELISSYDVHINSITSTYHT